jgi:Fe-S cluster assembly protein SufD
LEIYADDVKCSHGSTIGQLDKDALFYLRSRGLDFESARSLLSYAFASEVVGRVKIPPMRARLDEYVLTKFKRN